MALATLELPALLKLLADETRLRVLGLVALKELGVGELAQILSISGSRLANHLRLLRESGLIRDRKEGSWRFVTLEREGVLPKELWSVVESLLSESPRFEADRARLEDVLEQRRARSRRYFDQVAPLWDTIGSDFATGAGRERVAASLVAPRLVVADVGSGTGYLSASLATLVRKLILVDHSPAMLDQARRNHVDPPAEIEFREGELDALPIEDGEVDAVLAGLVLHHAPDPLLFLAEAARVLAPSGVLVITDLLPHREAWLRETMADLRLGIAPDELVPSLERLGFVDIHCEPLPDRYIPERPEGGRADLPLFLLRARRPAADGHR